MARGDSGKTRVNGADGCGPDRTSGMAMRTDRTDRTRETGILAKRPSAAAATAL